MTIGIIAPNYLMLQQNLANSPGYYVSNGTVIGKNIAGSLYSKAKELAAQGKKVGSKIDHWNKHLL